VPKLTSDVPNELLRKKGIADEQLAQKSDERGRKRSAEENEAPYGERKRSRSTRSDSSTSVSTISTNLSRSPLPAREVRPDGKPTRIAEKRPPLSTSSYSRTNRGKRRRSTSSSLSYTSDSSFERSRRHHRDADRNTRRRHSALSPGIRGRDREYEGRKGSRRTRSRSYSRDPSQVARNRNSMTPSFQRNGDSLHVQGGRPRSRERVSMQERVRRYSNDNDRYGSSFRDKGHSLRDERAVPPPQRRERSLSPFSKRLALTQAMNMGK